LLSRLHAQEENWDHLQSMHPAFWRHGTAFLPVEAAADSVLVLA
jgi:hypothetical protein